MLSYSYIYSSICQHLSQTSINIIVVLFSAPTAAPESVTTPSVTSSTITVQWGMVPCIHQNGPITGYSVRYGEMGSGSTQTESATGNEAVISGLQTTTNYTVEVAAETSVGRGDYSEPIIVTTDSKIRQVSDITTHILFSPFQLRYQ